MAWPSHQQADTQPNERLVSHEHVRASGLGAEDLFRDEPKNVDMAHDVYCTAREEDVRRVLVASSKECPDPHRRSQRNLCCRAHTGGSALHAKGPGGMDSSSLVVTCVRDQGWAVCLRWKRERGAQFPEGRE